MTIISVTYPQLSPEKTVPYCLDEVTRIGKEKYWMVNNLVYRGLFTSLKFPYVQFPAISTKGSSLFPLLRKIVARLTRLGLVVLGVVCDGASDNKMFSLHNCSDQAYHEYQHALS